MILDQFTNSVSSVQILAIGDIMLDRYVYGHVSRISPEAPIPVLHVKDTKEMLGGVGNVLRNMVSLGAHCRFVGVIGDDDVGLQIEKLLELEDKVIANIIKDPSRKTPLKTRFIASSQQMLRADYEEKKWISLPLKDKIIAIVKEHIHNINILVLSDYAKGTLPPDLIQSLIDLAKSHNVVTLVDPKGHDYSIYKNADIITPNRFELEQASLKDVGTIEEIHKASKALIHDFSFSHILTTCGEEGMVLTSAQGDFHHLPTQAQSVFDVTGAGDTVVAALACAIGAKLPLDFAMRVANYAAGIVVGKPGTSIVTIDELIFSCQQDNHMLKSEKTVALDKALKKIELWKNQGLRVGFTNGCFDLLHPGHLSLLSQARACCDRLIVGLNSDKSIQRLKGKNRPVQDQFTRSNILASLQDVDLVVIFEEDTPLTLIMKIIPDLLVKGADYEEKDIIGADYVKEKGGQIKLARISSGYSTTNFIEKIQKQSQTFG